MRPVRASHHPGDDTCPRFTRIARGAVRQLIWFIVIGFFAGLIARAIMPGKQPMGLVMTTLLGIAGSFVGGFLSSLFTHTQAGVFHTSGIIGSIIGALVVLGLYLAVNNHRTHRTRAVV